jgi:hypothetical protein
MARPGTPTALVLDLRFKFDGTVSEIVTWNTSLVASALPEANAKAVPNGADKLAGDFPARRAFTTRRAFTKSGNQ